MTGYDNHRNDLYTSGLRAADDEAHGVTAPASTGPYLTPPVEDGPYRPNPLTEPDEWDEYMLERELAERNI